jgi:replicative DNA helicase
LEDIKLQDVAAERAVLGGIYQHGSDAYLDVADILDADTFTVDSHAAFYKCFEYILKDEKCGKLDLPSIYSTASNLGLSKIIDNKDDRQLLRSIKNFTIELSNIRKMAGKIQKLRIGRLLHSQLLNSAENIQKITGDEKISQILGIAEKPIFDLSSLLNNTLDGPKLMGEGLKDYYNYLVQNPVKQVGISSGLPYYDKSIGGGFRRKTVNVMGARPKTGKTMLADNVGYYVACQGIPVLNGDSEMGQEDHWNRILANISGVSIDDIESGQFVNNEEHDIKVKEAVKKLQSIPYHYISIAGQDFEDTISMMRRWITRYVGFEENGLCKPCLIIYDYLKLLSGDGLSRDIKEYQMLGFQMTTLHNFMVKYGASSLLFIQLNRDGITKEDTSAASGSDRIIWLCSNFSIFKKKSPEEIAEERAAGLTNCGTRKIMSIAARHGEGLEDGDYINIKTDYRYGRIVENKTRKTLETGFNSDNDNVQF